MTWGLAAAELLRLPVRLNGIELGRPVDLVLDAEGTRAVGLEVRCADEELRFLPLPAARIRENEIEIGSALLLLDEDSFYRTRSRTLASLRGLQVARGPRTLGTLADVVLGQDGRIEALVVDADSGVEYVRPDLSIHVARDSGRDAEPVGSGHRC